MNQTKDIIILVTIDWIYVREDRIKDTEPYPRRVRLGFQRLKHEDRVVVGGSCHQKRQTQERHN